MKFGAGVPSVAGLVHQVLQSADEPLSASEVLERACQIAPIRTYDPMATVRGALSQGALLVNVGDGRFGFLPRLINGSHLRLPLAANSLTDGTLSYPVEARHALFPSFFEINKRKDARPAWLRLPDGTPAELGLEHLGDISWGSRMPAVLREYLHGERAAAGDAVLISALDGITGAYDARLERRAQRGDAAVANRNRTIADIVEGLIAGSRSHDLPIWDIVIALLARGAFQIEPAPDPVESILEASPRFEVDAYGIWVMVGRRSTSSASTAVQPPTARERRAQSALDLVGFIETLAEGMHSDPGIFTARRAGVEIADASRQLRHLLRAELPGRDARRRSHHTPKARAYQLKCTLRDIKPAIWRRLLVRSDTPLDRLHNILQLAIGWSDYHLHEFVANAVSYGAADDDWSNDLEDERSVTLQDVISATGDRLLYRYDFGDGWECAVVVEKVLDLEPRMQYPTCLKGKRAGPPEDVGGAWGYAEFLEALADPRHPEHEQQLEWAGGEFDPEEFDAGHINGLFREFLDATPVV